MEAEKTVTGSVPNEDDSEILDNSGEDEDDNDDENNEDDFEFSEGESDEADSDDDEGDDMVDEIFPKKVKKGADAALASKSSGEKWLGLRYYNIHIIIITIIIIIIIIIIIFLLLL